MECWQLDCYIAFFNADVVRAAYVNIISGFELYDTTIKAMTIHEYARTLSELD